MTSRIVIVGIVGAVVLFLARGLMAAEPAASQPATQPVSQDGPVVVNDLLRISISDLMGPGVVTPLVRRVDENLQVSLPIVGRLSFKGLTLPQVADAVKRAYHDGNLIMNAQVSATRMESGTGPSVRPGPIAAGDFLRIEIGDLEGPGVVKTLTPTVPQDGVVALPKLKKGLQMIGLSEPDAEVAVKMAYREAQLMPNAMITVQKIAAKETAPATAPAK